MSTLNIAMPSLRKAAPTVKSIVYGRDKSAIALIALKSKWDKAASFAKATGNEDDCKVVWTVARPIEETGVLIRAAIAAGIDYAITPSTDVAHTAVYNNALKHAEDSLKLAEKAVKENASEKAVKDVRKASERLQTLRDTPPASVITFSLPYGVAGKAADSDLYTV